MTLPKYDLNWCKNYAKQHNGECLSPQYLGRTTKHLYRCESGHEFYATPFAHIHKKSWCNECSNRDTAHTLDFVKECKILKKYILKNGIRYSVRNEEKNLGFYLSRLSVEQNNTINIQILVSSDAGTVYRDHGIRFYINCREGTKHNEPHIHVDIRYGEATGAFSLKTGQQLTGDKIGRKDKKIIEETISLHQSEFLQYWNEHTDGLDVDLNQVLGLIKY